MSVINNVLKDLESKPSSFTPLDLQAQLVNKTSRNQSYVKMALLLGLLMVAVIFLANQSGLIKDLYSDLILVTQEQSLNLEPTKIVSPVIDTSKQVDKIVLSADEQMPVEIENVSAEITGMQINETSEFLELSLLLTRPAQSYLKQQGQNSYVFVISDTQVKIMTPVIRNNEWLKDINFIQGPTGAEVRFDTVDGVLVQTEHQVKDEKHQWVVKLKKKIAQFSSSNETKKQTVELALIEPVKPESIITQQNESAPVRESTSEVTPKASQVKLEIKPAKTQRPDRQFLNEAMQSMRDKNWSQAEVQLLELLGGSLDQEARLNLIKVFKVQSRISELNELIARSLIQYPNNMEFKLFDAQQLFATSQYQSLINRYQHPNNSLPLLTLLSASYQRMGQHDRAIHFYQQAIKIDPQQPKNWISMAISQEHEGQYDAAISSYKMALRSGAMNSRLQDFTQQRIRSLGGS